MLFLKRKFDIVGRTSLIEVEGEIIHSVYFDNLQNVINIAFPRMRLALGKDQ